MKIQKLRTSVFIVVIFLGGSMFAWAQAVVQEHKIIKAEVKAGEQGRTVTVTTFGDPQAHVSTYTFVASEMGFESQVLKGRPFSADTVTEFTQILGNGQRIYRNSTAAIYRDSEGRTRREQTIDAIGPYASSGPAQKTVFINDPVAGVSYIINPVEHSATKTVVHEGSGVAGPGMVTWVAKSGDASQVHVTANKIVLDGVKTTSGEPVGVVGGTAPRIVHETNVRTEPLGTQVIEGVTAEGKRTIETIPAGSIGNETPIEIVSERWYSEELGVVVKTVRNDPLSGQNVYQLKNIRRSEPSPDLFQVPADYAVKESVVKIQTIKK
jgi:hypothetical protein